MIGAGEALRQAAISALEAVPGLSGIYPGPPLQAVYPHAVVDSGLESDWSHKGGAGREVRLAVTIRDKGERPARAQGLMALSGALLDLLGGDVGGWQIVTMAHLRSRLVPPRTGGADGWAAVIEYRARMLAG